MPIKPNSNWLKQKIIFSRGYQEKAFHEVNELVFKKREGREITLTDDTKLIEFVSCSYLGLDLDPRIISATTHTIADCGFTFPAARTRIKAQSFVTLEMLLNKIFCNGYSTTFSSLHLGHLGVIPLLASGEMPSFPICAKGPAFIVDKTCHASIQIHRALMQQFGEVSIIDFQQEDDLKHQFKHAYKNGKTPIAIADSIGSMGGLAPVALLFKLAEQFGGYIYLDDAHGTSTYGRHGCGYVLDALHNQFHPRLILASSLAKAFGVVAGVIVVPTKNDEEMIKHFSPTYIFGGPPALPIIDAAIASAHIHLSDEIHQLQRKLRENIQYFDSLLQNHIVNSQTLSPIRGLWVGEELKAIEHTKALKERGFAVTAAMYPTVQKNKSILRVALSAAHRKNDILNFCNSVKEIISHHQHEKINI